MLLVLYPYKTGGEVLTFDFVADIGTGYDGAGNYVEDSVVDQKQYRDLEVNRLEKKRKKYLKLIKNDSKNHLNYYYLGNIYLELNYPKKAIIFYEKNLKLNPKNGKAHYQIAKAYDRINDTNNAIKHITLANEIFNHNLDLHWKTKANVFLLQLRDQ